ncbi:mei2-like protein [Fusarium pseudocircinatum]|uniref:Mei2-like protein n=1 Tax=Fusarium pseudocircinatum TaxID=56676 RepID=A0A8H5PGB1_9HYPO|nr:mei2-like protein [Fusarium pseudocircinatum]
MASLPRSFGPLMAPIGQRSKGKNALVFYPEGSPTVAGALSQDMDLSRPCTDHASRQPHTEPPTFLSSHLPQPASSTSSPTHWIMLRNIPNKDGQPPSAQVAGVSLSGGPVACFDSGWPELFGGLVARRSVYGAHMLPQTTEFGVSVEEARQLHQKQKAEDTAKAAAAQDGGGIWDGTQTQNDNPINNLI